MNTNVQPTDKFLGFFSVTPSKKFFSLFKRAGIKNVLISYFYIRQHLDYMEELLPELVADGGVFMTDSGVFSFLNDPNFDVKGFDWEAYIKEYTSWLKAHSKYIFSACNLDMDAYITHRTILMWNEQYFKPLEDDINIIYVAHRNIEGCGELGMVKEYCKLYDYVGVSEELIGQASQIYQLAKQTKTAIHGLAWTKPTVLRDYPFFSVDSTSWVNYQKFGSTPVWDGKNFTQYDSNNKSIRKTLKNVCTKYGVKFDEFCSEKNPDGTHNDDEGLTYSLRTWLDVLNDLGRMAKTKLSTTLADLMEDKQFQLVGSPTSAKKGLSGALANLNSSPSKSGVDYEQKEDGSEVAVYKKRTDMVPITAMEEIFGSALFCSNCYIQDKCPKFETGSSCAFDFSPANLKSDPFAVIEHLISVQMDRVNRAMLMEKMEGGMPNKTYTHELNVLNSLNSTKADMIVRAKTSGVRYVKETLEINQVEGTEQPTNKAGGFLGLLTDLMKKD